MALADYQRGAVLMKGAAVAMRGDVQRWLIVNGGRPHA